MSPESILVKLKETYYGERRNTEIVELFGGFIFRHFLGYESAFLNVKKFYVAKRLAYLFF